MIRTIPRNSRPTPTSWESTPSSTRCLIDGDLKLKSTSSGPFILLKRNGEFRMRCRTLEWERHPICLKDVGGSALGTRRKIIRPGNANPAIQDNTGNERVKPSSLEMR